MVPRGKIVTPDNCVEEVLKRTATSVMRRRMEDWPPAVGLSSSMSQIHVLSPSSTTARTQCWCQTNFPAFWAEGVWSGNSPEPSPIENLWAIAQEKIDKIDPAKSEATLIETFR